MTILNFPRLNTNALGIRLDLTIKRGQAGLEQHLKEERQRAEDGLLLHDIGTYRLAGCEYVEQRTCTRWQGLKVHDG